MDCPDCPEWLDNLVDSICDCFETVGEMEWDWTGNANDGYEVTIYPCLAINHRGSLVVHGDIRLDVADVLTFFDKDPTIQWHLTGQQPGAFHVEGKVDGSNVWIYFREHPPPGTKPSIRILEDGSIEDMVLALN